MTRSRDISDVQKNLGGAVAPFVAGKNKIINGDFSQWQRGVTFNNVSTGDYTADRWITALRLGAGGHTINITRQSFTLGSAPVAGYESAYYLQVQRSVAGDECYFGQKIEDVRTFAGQTVTFSFWARVTSGTFTMARVFLNQQFGSGGSAETDNIGAIIPTLTTTWQRFTSTVTVPSIAGKTIGTNSNLYLLFQLGNVNNTATLQFWGVQVEAGNAVTPFTPAGGGFPGAELALCQRYYYRIIPNPGTSYCRFSSYAPADSTTSLAVLIQPAVTMRTVPNVLEYSNLTLYGGGFATFTNAVISVDCAPQLIQIGVSGSGMTQFRPYALLANNTSNSYLAIGAEL